MATSFSTAQDQTAAASSLGQAFQFLSSARRRGGWWVDFRTSEGTSDAWVTAYVGARLAGIRHPLAQQLAEDAWRRLSRRRWWLPGWAYNYTVPLDADSTIWAVRLAERLGISSSRIRKAYGFIAGHADPSSGGIATYMPRSRIHRHIGLPGPSSAAGWYAPQACVTAAAAGLEHWPDRRALFAFLLERQSGAGCWEGYWWSDPEYPTSLAAAAFRRFPEALDTPRPLEAALAWCESRLAAGPVRTDHAPNGSPFATACALLALCGSPEKVDRPERIRTAAAWLIESQETDGSWPASARLRLPPPHIPDAADVTDWQYTDERDAGTVKLDHQRVYTTATAAAALDLFRRTIRNG